LGEAQIIEFTEIEIITVYIETSKTIKISYQLCKCGIFSYEQSPIFKQEISTIPVYKRNTFSLAEHDKLRYFIMDKATKLAEKIILTKRGCHPGESRRSWLCHDSST
jgi:hypothetical protein